MTLVFAEQCYKQRNQLQSPTNTTMDPGRLAVIVIINNYKKWMDHNKTI